MDRHRRLRCRPRSHAHLRSDFHGRNIDEDWLEENFPLGDGVADTSAWLTCPYCATRFQLAVDPGGEAIQQYVEDCEVCCRPCHLTVSWNETGRAHVDARTEEEI